MAFTAVKFEQFDFIVGKKQIDFSSDTIKYALTNTEPDPAYTILGDITEIDYTNLTDDGPGTREMNITEYSSGPPKTVLTLDNIILTASGGAVAEWQYLVFYDDDSTGDLLIAYYDYGLPVNMADTDSLVIAFTDNFISWAY